MARASAANKAQYFERGAVYFQSSFDIFGENYLNSSGVQ